MSSVNKAIVVGNLGRDPETRYSQSGDPITNFSVATSEKWKDKTTGDQRESTEWHNCVCFGRTAEIAGEYLAKGSKVYVEGQLKTSSWEKDGQKHYRTEINVRDLKMLNKVEASEQRAAPPPGVPAGYEGVSPEPADTGWDDSDSIPFAPRTEW